MLRLRCRIVRGVPDGRVPAQSSAMHCGKVDLAAWTVQRRQAEADAVGPVSLPNLGWTRVPQRLSARRRAI
jgi:hypothetical protein